MDMLSSAPTRGYEFNTQENAIIGRTGTYVRVWGILTLASGVLMGLAAALVLLSGEPYALAVTLIYGALAAIPIFIGLYFIRAGGALRDVVQTAGGDISHLMSAMDNLRRAFAIQVIAVAVWIGLVVLGFVVGAFVVAAR